MKSPLPIRKHKDPAIQAEFANVYRLLSSLCLSGRKKILTGQAAFSPSGTEIAIGQQENTGYCVTITPIEGGSFSVARLSDKFIVTSDTEGEFIWSAIIDI